MLFGTFEKIWSDENPTVQTVRGKLSPGKFGPGQLGRRQLGPGQLGPAAPMPNLPLLGADSWAPDKLGLRQVDPETIVLYFYVQYTNTQIQCISKYSE